ncbi:Frag1/DRAM/Sfk1 [Trypanosoma melophagium]|uniref:Frag1/DRAM/Sfk1 n=1 Tax=Trypanosoma melophagium TaxID=715481 RepID=UPI00351AA685|nr:Frag1/DRAM/Sfk1 [Trypanosoma melophagium]
MDRHIFVFPSSYAAVIYALTVGTGLLFALFVGLWMHHTELLSTHCGTPEYWPSISTLSGDFQPERQIWRVAFVLCAPFRLGATISLFSVFWQRACGYNNSSNGGTLSALMNMMHSPIALFKSTAFLTLMMFGWDLGRLIGGLTWTMISSAENLDRHNLGFGFYVFLGFILQVVVNIIVRRNTYNMNIYANQEEAHKSQRLKLICLIGQTTSAIFLVIFFIRHRITCAAGAYSLSTMCEWCFAAFNILFDTSAWYELKKDAWVFGASPQEYRQWIFTYTSESKDYQRGIKEYHNNMITEEDAGNCSERGNNSDNTISVYSLGILSADYVDRKNVVVHEFNIYCAPSNASMWLVDIYWSFLFWEMIMHIIEHMYFMPLVAMSVSWEVVSILAFCSPVLLQFKLFRRWALGYIPCMQSPKKSEGIMQSTQQRIPMYILFYFLVSLSHFHMFVRHAERLKLLAVAVGPFFLSLATFCRYLYPCTFTNDTEDESRRLLYCFPLGLVCTMLVRVLFITQDPVFTHPLYSALFGIILGIVSTAFVYRQVMFGGTTTSTANNSMNSTNINGVTNNNNNNNNNNSNNNNDMTPEESIKTDNSRHVHFSRPYTSNTITSLVMAYPPSSPILLGLLFGFLTAASLTFYTCANYIPRLLAIDPYPANLFVIISFVLGIYYSHDIVPLLRQGKDGNKRHGGFSISWLRLGIGLLGGCLTMLLATRQTNRSYEIPHEHYTNTTESVKGNVDISHWAVEEDFSGNKYIAFAGGLVMTLCIGALYPIIMELIFIQQRVRRLSDISIAESSDAAKSLHDVDFTRVTLFEFTWSLTTFCVVFLYALCISYPFVPMAWIIRERSVLIHFSNILGIFICTWYLAHKARSSIVQKGLKSTHAKKQRRLPLFMMILIGIVFFFVIICREALQPPDRSIPEGKTTAQRLPAEVISVHEALVKLYTMRNAGTDPLLAEYERTFIEENYMEKRSLLEDLVKGKNDTKNKLFKKSLKDFNISLDHLTLDQRSEVWEAASGMTFFSGMIWTVHFALDNANTDSLTRMAEEALKTEAGVVGLLESDSMHVTNGNRDMVEFMSYSLGYRYTSYGPTALDNTYGCAMISKYPILRVRRYIMPSPLGELACLIHAELDVFGITIQTYVGHFGNTEHWADGLLQSQFLGRMVTSHPGPSMFLGYVVSYPGNKERYHYYVSRTQPAFFRDTALEMYRDHPWYRMQERGGYDEPEPEKTTVAPDTPIDFNVDWKLEHVGHLEEGMQTDVSFRRTPEGQPLRYFKYNDTGRITNFHPRFEFIDRYCQYILYKTGREADEWSKDYSRLEKMELYLYDWRRVLTDSVTSLSDTELQVVQLGFKLRSTD